MVHIARDWEYTRGVAGTIFLPGHGPRPGHGLGVTGLSGVTFQSININICYYSNQLCNGVGGSQAVTRPCLYKAHLMTVKGVAVHDREKQMKQVQLL